MPASRRGRARTYDVCGGPPAPYPTCASLGANTTPAGAFAYDNAESSAPYVDIYIDEAITEVTGADGTTRKARTLIITRTTALRECDLRIAGYGPLAVSYASFSVTRVGPSETEAPPPFTPGSYPLDANGGWVESLGGGPECSIVVQPVPDGQGGCSAGISAGGAGNSSGSGTLTITEVTSTRLRGVIDVVLTDAHPKRLTFDAPICKPEPVAHRMCCTW
ncbi:MAG: hypothetical protein U0270_41270 [Labilithrix sp.]